MLRFGIVGTTAIPCRTYRRKAKLLAMYRRCVDVHVHVPGIRDDVLAMAVFVLSQSRVEAFRRSDRESGQRRGPTLL